MTAPIGLYLNLGLALFPCHYPIINGSARCSCGNRDCTDNAAKHPYGLYAPNGFHSASKDRRIIKRWADGPYNIAVATGAVSGIVAVDVDPRNGGAASLIDLQAENGDLPVTWKALTGGGGEHYVFRHPGRFVGCSESKIALGIDVKGDGGYVIVAPSRHISGRCYAWDVDHHPELTGLADMPAWLLEAALTGSGGDKPKFNWKQFADEPIPAGKRHDKLRSLAGLLFYRLSREPHLAAQLLVAFNDTRCEPPLPKEELAGIIDHAVGREIKRRRAE